MNLYVAKLPYDLSQEGLETLFKPFNPSSVKLIIDRETGHCKGFGFVEIPDEQQARAAIQACNGKQVGGQNITVKEAEERRGDRPVQAGNGSRGQQERGAPAMSRSQRGPAGRANGKDRPVQREDRSSSSDEHAPYAFHKRPGGKAETLAFHDALNAGHYDIAFDVTWRTLTPTAANPCTDPHTPETCPENQDSEYRGYNRRWLMIDNRLAISPFTVKSAVANGVAAVLGGCYRVPTKIEKHAEIKEGQYPYTGAYKRYRVAMDKSKPGIILENQEIADGFRKITIQPVNEYYYDSHQLPEGIQLGQGRACYARTTIEKHKNFVVPGSLHEAGGSPAQGEKRLLYFGPYRFGMDLGLKPGDLGKRHYHRFYEETGKPVSVELPPVHFVKDAQALGELVYVGKFKRQQPAQDPREDCEGGPWFQHLAGLKKDDWVYYQQLGKEIGGIGKNFQFKTIFMHEDAVPEENKACKDPQLLCPRCRLFGMTAADSPVTNGLRGRFKASALCTSASLTENVEPASIPRLGEKGIEHVPVEIRNWASAGELVCRQMLLPIQGPPKPNKRDTDGYYEKDSGDIKGSKHYPHGSGKVRNFDVLDAFIKETDRRTTNHEADQMPYAHHLRNYAQVCREGVEFSGTLGAENCNIEEVSALVLLLERGLSDFGFKIGIGKAFGLGSVASKINSVWVRKSNDYKKWVRIGGDERLKPEEMLRRLGEVVPDLAGEVASRKQVVNGLNRLDGMIHRHPAYPKPGFRYWKDFNDSAS